MTSRIPLVYTNSGFQSTITSSNVDEESVTPVGERISWVAFSCGWSRRLFEAGRLVTFPSHMIGAYSRLGCFVPFYRGGEGGSLFYFLLYPAWLAGSVARAKVWQRTCEAVLRAVRRCFTAKALARAKRILQGMQDNQFINWKTGDQSNIRKSLKHLLNQSRRPYGAIFDWMEFWFDLE